MNSIYSDANEEKILSRKTATTWHRSGLITDEQMAFIKTRTETDLRQTNVFLRITLFFFTLIALQALTGFVTVFLDLRNHTVMTWVFMILGIVACVLAEYVASRYSLYRYGVEEALYLMGMIGFTFSLCYLLFGSIRVTEEAIPWLIFFALASGWLYGRLGLWIYAAVALALAGGIPFTLKIPQEYQRLMTMALLSFIFFLIALWEDNERRDFRKAHCAPLQSLCLGGIYLLANLHLTTLMMMGRPHAALPPYQGVSPAAYWISYALVWTIPMATLFWGILSRKRIVIDVSLICAALTLATNKDYLGWRHYAWDPIILGTTLVLSAIFLKRWLAGGEEKMRGGFTAEKILAEEKTAQDLLQGLAATAVTDTGPTNTAVEKTEQPFEEGSSGGGGASGNY